MIKTLGQLTNTLTNTEIHENMNYEVYANPNENDKMLINIII